MPAKLQSVQTPAGAGFVIGTARQVGLPYGRNERSKQMKMILVALAALGLTASAALADCAYHTTQNTNTSDEAKPTSATQ